MNGYPLSRSSPMNFGAAPDVPDITAANISEASSISSRFADASDGVRSSTKSSRMRNPPQSSNAVLVEDDDGRAPPSLAGTAVSDVTTVTPSSGTPPPLLASPPSQLGVGSGLVVSPLSNSHPSTEASRVRTAEPDNHPPHELVIREKTGNNAKDTLHKRFDLGHVPGSPHRLHYLIPKGNFVSFSQPGMNSNVALWSVAFVCPLTGEVFLSGRLFARDSRYICQDGIHWYATAKEAKEAASGRAEDCFRLRELDVPSRSVLYQFCCDEAYTQETQPKRPNFISGELLETIRCLRESSLQSQCAGE